MHGQIMVQTDYGYVWRWVYVPAANIQVRPIKNGIGEWVVTAFRTDGFFRVNDGAVPMMEHLRATCQFTTEVEVPDHIVQFAVESELLRHETVEGIAEILEQTNETNQAPKGLRDFIKLVSTSPEALAQHELEQEIGEELNKLIEASGGLQ